VLWHGSMAATWRVTGAFEVLPLCLPSRPAAYQPLCDGEAAAAQRGPWCVRGLVSFLCVFCFRRASLFSVRVASCCFSCSARKPGVAVVLLGAGVPSHLRVPCPRQHGSAVNGNGVIGVVYFCTQVPLI
jgi:hypothetical protein